MTCLSCHENDETKPIVQGDHCTHDDDDDDDESGDDGCEDPWALASLEDETSPWETLDRTRKCNRACMLGLKIVALLGLLYLFICSLDSLSSAFRLLGGKAAGEALSRSVILNNPVAGVMVGVLVTVLVQSSSTATSILVSMVASHVLTLRQAIPVVMGCNIGTTVTNTLVALGQVHVKRDFRRAFAAATVHDFFNWLCVIVLLPLEVATGYLYHITGVITRDLDFNQSDTRSSSPKFLKALTEPLTKNIVALSSAKIKAIARGEDVNGSIIKPGDHIFSHWSGSDGSAGAILLVASVAVLCGCLLLIVTILSSMMRGSVAKALQRTVNADLPGCWRHVTGYVAMAVGAILTVLVQSSSVLTSALTPLVGLGAVHLERVYPIVLGANLGTTVTGLLAALVSDASSIRVAVRLALSHLLFNFSGILLWYPWPPSRTVALSAAKTMGETVARYPWFAVVYLLLAFLIVPLIVFALSLTGPSGLAAVGIPVILLLLFVGVINFLQRKDPDCLPERLQHWEKSGIPKPLRSLAPYDKLFRRSFMRLCKKKPRNKVKVLEAGRREQDQESNLKDFTALKKD